MILSMTGFGRGSEEIAGKVITNEVKALNSKQLDLTVKLPSRYRRLEGWVRREVAVEALRGKIEMVVSVETTAQQEAGLLNTELIRQYKSEIESLDDALGINHPEDWHSVLLRLPDVLRGEEKELGDSETKAFEEACRRALKRMEDFRRQEGAKLEEFFKGKIEEIRRLLLEVEPHEASRVAKIKARLTEQLDKLTGVEVDAGRLEQELIYYIEKLDINEEKQRLTSHMDYFLATMEDDSEISKGKKLGFIAQEMGREINTLGSKSNNAEMQILVVKMKDELEQIKEQVLNVL